MIRTFHHAAFDPHDLVAAKGDEAISICLPARDEERTIGAIVARIREELQERVPLVDEILVLDDHSQDRTAEVATEAGAEVFPVSEIRPELGERCGKGEALWKSLLVAKGDLIAWCDADVENFVPGYVTGLLGPLLTDPDIAFVKGFYERPLHDGMGGGRVTELLARPVLSLLFPQLAEIAQPLSGEYAGRRSVLERLPFTAGYGVDLGLLLDVATHHGVDAIAQTDLGVRIHRNRPLDELGPQAMAVLEAALRRSPLTAELVGSSAVLHRPGRPTVEIDVSQRPPVIDIPTPRRHTA